MDKPICYEKDYKEIRELFRNCIQSEIEENSNINVAKLIQEFENNLLQNLQILPDIEEDRTNKNFQSKMDSFQSEALTIKTNLHAHKVAFIENVRTNIEQELNLNHPTIEEFIEEEEYGSDQDEIDETINTFDKRIGELQQDLEKTKSSMDLILQKSQNILNSASILPNP